MNRTELFSLSAYLSQHITLDADVDAQGCDHTFRYVDAWLRERQLDRETWLGWLQQRGGWCDCQVVELILLADPAALGEATPALPIAAFRSWTREH